MPARLGAAGVASEEPKEQSAPTLAPPPPAGSPARGAAARGSESGNVHHCRRARLKKRSRCCLKLEQRRNSNRWPSRTLRSPAPILDRR